MKRAILFLAAMMTSFSLWAAIDAYQFKSQAQEEEYRSLTESLRCPKCQNNSIADSGAIIAADMRQKVYDMLQQGQSRQQIINYMVGRYGNFVNYNPPVTASTLILWAGPLLFVIGGAAVIILRSRRKNIRSQLDVAEQQRLAALLDNDRKPL